MIIRAHIHDDDLELYKAGRLEPESVPELEAHLSECPDCQERLRQCIALQLQDAHRTKGEQ